MKKRSLKFLAKGVGYSTAVFFDHTNHGRSMPNIGQAAFILKLV
jgi:hypothetical protein